MELILSELRKVYRRRGRPDVHAVRGIDLRVADGELLALLGPSGCGKTSTLRMIAGLERVTSGDIMLGGRSVVGLPPHARGIGVAFENYALYPPLTVEQNIAFGLQARGERDTAGRVRDIAERLGISGILGQKPGSLSSGQKQRVSLARALARRPRVLLLDEPLSHLDAAQREQTRRELKRVQRETAYTTVLVTHDQQEALSLADRVAVMDGGRLLQVGTPEEVYDDPANLFVAGFVGEPPMNLISGRVDGRGTVALGDGIELPVAVAAAAGKGAEETSGRAGSAGDSDAGRPVRVGLRPEDIRLEGELPATVVVFEPLLETGLATVELPAGAGSAPQRLVVQTEPDARLERGQRVGLAVDPERVPLFDAETGERVR